MQRHTQSSVGLQDLTPGCPQGGIGRVDSIFIPKNLLFAPISTKIKAMADERAISGALELLGRRWALRVVWELRRDAVSFNELRERAGISPSVLSARLAELAEAGVVERDIARRYRLTGRGRELARILYELNRWAEAGGGMLAA